MYTGPNVKYPYSCQISMKLEFPLQIFEKSSNVKFNYNSSSGSLVIPCGRTYGRIDRHDEANYRCEKRLKIKKSELLHVI
jgi:hypothetical protein